MSTDSQRLAIAAHLHVALRRKTGRVTDTEWLASNLEYAQAIIRLCRSEADADLQALASRLEASFEALRTRRPKAPHAIEAANEVPSRWHDTGQDSALDHDARAQTSRAASLEQRYVGRLR
jgi:hypothetical protein